MIYPSLDELLKHADNRFALVSITAKRARQILLDQRGNDDCRVKAVTLAFQEIVAGKTKFEITKTGIK